MPNVRQGFRAGFDRIEARVAQALVTLARYGRITPLSDGRYAARLAAVEARGTSGVRGVQG